MKGRAILLKAVSFDKDMGFLPRVFLLLAAMYELLRQFAVWRSNSEVAEIAEEARDACVSDFYRKRDADIVHKYGDIFRHIISRR